MQVQPDGQGQVGTMARSNEAASNQAAAAGLGRGSFTTHDYRDVLRRAFEHAVAFRQSLSARPPRPVGGAPQLDVLFGGPTPETGLAGDEVIDALVAAAEPGLLRSAGPRSFAWVMGASHPVGVAADWLTSAWGQNSAIFATSPAAAAVEKAAAQWLLDILDLPRAASVGFATGATMANFVCLAAARTALLAGEGWDVEADGLQGAPQIRVFIGADAHTSVFAALQYLGIGHARAVRVATDAQGRMNAGALCEAMKQGDGPPLVVAQAGQINSGACDPFIRIADLCRDSSAWLHIDGAFGLWARSCPDLAHLTSGLERADSWATDGHKWLQVPYDCGYAIVRDAEAHRRAMTIAASYLPSAADGEFDPSGYVPELSRRARGFATWAMIRALGREGIATMVGQHCALARRISTALAAEPGIEILNDVVLNQVVIGFGPGLPRETQDALARAVVARVQNDNVCFVGGADWKGRSVMRISVISCQTTEADADTLANAVARAWGNVQTDHMEKRLGP
jgi:glutamate/tyrosine decarboxylase-like PLP-dependent enzyme